MADINRNDFDHLNSDQQAEQVRDLFCSLVDQDERVEPVSKTASEVQPPKAVETEWLFVEEQTVQGEDTHISTDEPLPSMPQGIESIILTDYEDDEEIGQEDDAFETDFHEMPLILTGFDDENDVDEDDVPTDATTFILPAEESNADENKLPTVTEKSVTSRNPLKVLWNSLCDNVPLPCDGIGAVLRKTVFWISWVIFAGALTYILYNVWWQPALTEKMYHNVETDYHPNISGTVDEGTDYPPGMQLSFQSLYDRNPQTRGWLSYHATGNRDFLNIEYPIMYSGDNKKYLTTDFNGNANKNGALFFDMRSKLESSQDSNVSLIVYGHNMASGQMLAGLNRFIGNVNNARSAATLTMNTLYSNAEYKVFAVVLTDESAQNKYYYNVRRTEFADEADFNNYIAQLRERSLFDYPVDVQAGDELLLLSTCTAPSTAKIKDGRLTVIARKVRVDESPAVDTSMISKNEDVIMPHAWYTAQKLNVHMYYSEIDSLMSENSFENSSDNWQTIVSYLEQHRRTTTTVISKTTTAQRTIRLSTTTDGIETTNTTQATVTKQTAATSATAVGVTTTTKASTATTAAPTTTTTATTVTTAAPTTTTTATTATTAAPTTMTTATTVTTAAPTTTVTTTASETQATVQATDVPTEGPTTVTTEPVSNESVTEG